MDVVERVGEQPIARGVGDARNPAEEVEGQPLAAAARGDFAADERGFGVRRLRAQVPDVGRAEQQKAVHAGVRPRGQVADRFVRAEGMSGQHDAPVAARGGPVHPRGDVLLGPREALVPRARGLGASGAHVVRRDLAEGVAGLRVDEMRARGVDRRPEVDVERVGVKIAVDARDREHDGVRRGVRRVGEKRAEEHRAARGGGFDLDRRPGAVHRATPFAKRKTQRCAGVE